jgi:ribonuclease HII
MARKKFDRSLIPPSPDLSFEQALWRKGFTLVAGIDEAGRGALTGPVAVGAVILPADLPDLATKLPGVRDSKQLTSRGRDHTALLIKQVALTWAVGLAEAAEIDQLGIAPATRLAAMRAIEQLASVPQHLLIDYLKLPKSDLPQTSLVKGDQRSLSIACASILAKTTRDELMVRLSEQYPIYGFARHKGYGTATHLAAIRAYGPCPIHRRSFSPFSQPNS